MTRVRFKSAVLWTALVVLARLAPSGVRASDIEPTREPARSSKLDLTRDSTLGLFGLIRPQEAEWRHLQVRWLTDVVAARKLAATEDKPIVVLYTGGAGYNEPLGVC